MAKKFLNHFTLRPNNDFMVLYFAFYSNRKDKTFPRNLQFFRKMAKNLILRTRAF